MPQASVDNIPDQKQPVAPGSPVELCGERQREWEKSEPALKEAENSWESAGGSVYSASTMEKGAWIGFRANKCCSIMSRSGAQGL